MIYLCQSCGWRINERNHTTHENIGKHLLYNHMAFCSNNCIEHAKSNPQILGRTVKPSDWNEEGWTENGVWSNWKTNRKRK